MIEHTPQEMPPAEVIARTDMASAMPIQEPPSEIVMESEITSGSRPSEPLADAEEVVGSAVAGATWHSNKKITSLWLINENRNSWVGISDVGWRKLANNSDSAVVALTMLSSHAKQMNRTVNAYEDDKKMIKEIYVW